MKTTMYRTGFIAAVLLIFFMTFLSGSRAYADAADRFDITIEKDTSDLPYFISLEDIHVKVKVRNNGDDFDGTLKLTVAVDKISEKSISYAKSFSIAEKETGTCSFTLSNMSIGDSSLFFVKAELLSNEGMIVYSKLLNIPVIPENDSFIMVGILSENAALSRKMSKSSWFNSADGAQIMFKAFDITESMIDREELGRFDIMIIDRELDEKEKEAVEHWLSGGGCILLAEGSDQFKLEKTDNEEIYRHLTGKVMTYDPGKDITAGLLSKINRLYTAGIIDPYNDIGDISQYTSSSFDEYTDTVNIMPFICILLIYLIIVVPLCWIFLKKKDRKEYIWAVVPAFAAIFFVLVYAAGSPYRFKKTFVRNTDIISLGEDAAFEEGILNVNYPSEGIFAFQVDRDIEIKSAAYMDGYNHDSTEYEMNRIFDAVEHDVVFADNQDSTDIIVNHPGKFAFDSFIYRQKLEPAGRIESKLYADHGGISGTVTNKTDMPVKGSMLITNGMYIPVGPMQPGESISLDNEKYKLLNLQDNSAGLDIGMLGTDESFFEEAGMKNDSAFCKNAANILRYITAKSKYSFIVAITDNDPSIMKNFDGNDDHGICYLTDKADITVGTDKERTVLIDFGKYDDMEGFESYEHIVYSYSGTTFEGIYEFDKDIDITYLRWIDSSENISLRFYDHEKKEYVRVLEETDHMEKEELEKYLDDNVLKVSFDIMDSDWEYVPAFTVTGGGRRD